MLVTQLHLQALQRKRISGGGSDYLTGIGMRYIADDVAGSDGDPVTTWTDASGNGYDLTQATSGQRPTVQTSEVNGHNAVRFDGSDDEMYPSAFGVIPLAGFSTATAQTIFVVIKQDSSQALNCAMKWINGGSFIEIYPTYSDTLYYDHENFTTGRISGAQPGGWDDAWHVLECVRGGADMAMLVDGASVASRADASGNYPSGDSTYFLGSAGGGLPFKGDIAEVRVYPSDIGSTNRSTVRNYLKSIYGTP